MSKSVYAWRQTFGPRRGEAINVACHFLSSSSSHRMNLCERQLRHFFFTPRFDYCFLSVCLCLCQILVTFTFLPLCLSFCRRPHPFCSSPSFYLSVSFCFFLIVPPPPPPSPISPPGMLCLLLVSFSSSGGWRCVSLLWLPRGCCGNNICHFVVQKLTEMNEKWKKMQHSKNMQNR